MNNDGKKSNKRDPDKINMNEKYEREYWGKKLWVTPEKLKEASIAMGAKVKDVEQRLRP
jgi:hypothetical protein